MYKQLGEHITLAHGAGGSAMHDLIEKLFIEKFHNPMLARREDQAVIDHALLARGRRLAFTTDSFVVTPLFFPGGDIGTLSVNGTVNDLAMSGARPCWLSCGFIIEEGFAIRELARIADSMRMAAERVGVEIVTGDTKVVPRGAADKLFINTAGIGLIETDSDFTASAARPGDKVIVSGPIGEHGAAIIIARGELELEAELESDCAPLWPLVESLLALHADIRCLRDPTRGGLATTLNEIAAAARVNIVIEEPLVPVRAEVRGVCELLGLDPLYVANEGRLVAIVEAAAAERAIALLRQLPSGAGAAIIGEVTDASAGRVLMRTPFGGTRVIDMLVGEQLPRIC